MFFSCLLFLSFSLPPSFSVSPFSVSPSLHFSVSTPLVLHLCLSPQSLCPLLPLLGPCWPPGNPWHGWTPGPTRNCDHDAGKKEIGWHSFGGVEPLFGAPLTASCLIVPVCKRLPQRTPSLLPAGPGSGNNATGSGAWRTIRGIDGGGGGRRTSREWQRWG